MKLSYVLHYCNFSTEFIKILVTILCVSKFATFAYFYATNYDKSDTKESRVCFNKHITLKVLNEIVMQRSLFIPSILFSSCLVIFDKYIRDDLSEQEETNQFLTRWPSQMKFFSFCNLCMFYTMLWTMFKNYKYIFFSVCISYKYVSVMYL